MEYFFRISWLWMNFYSCLNFYFFTIRRLIICDGYIYTKASLLCYTTWCWLFHLSNTCACECVTVYFQGLSWFYSEKYAKQTMLHKTPRTYIQSISLFAKASQLSYSRCKTSQRSNSNLLKDFCNPGRSRQTYIKALIWWRRSSCH